MLDCALHRCVSPLALVWSPAWFAGRPQRSMKQKYKGPQSTNTTAKTRTKTETKKKAPSRRTEPEESTKGREVCGPVQFKLCSRCPQFVSTGERCPSGPSRLRSEHAGRPPVHPCLPPLFDLLVVFHLLHRPTQRGRLTPKIPSWGPFRLMAKSRPATVPCARVAVMGSGGFASG